MNYHFIKVYGAHIHMQGSCNLKFATFQECY